MKYYTHSIEEVAKHLSTSIKKGLSTKKANELLNQYGENKLQEAKKKSLLVIFINQFRSFIIYILLFAIILSSIQGEYVDAIVILVILLVNAIIGFVQEIKAEKAVDSLKKLSALHIHVLRNGKKQRIDAQELVPGDIIFIEEGTKVPADARIITSSGLYVNESSLTGESVSVLKDTTIIKKESALANQKNMVFSGTLVTRGKATAIVTSTGMDSQIGKIATMISSVKEKLTPLQKKLNSLGKKIGLFTIVISLIILITGIFTENLFMHIVDGNYALFLAGAGKWLLLAVALAVAAVPEGLPAIVTIALSSGMKKMVKRNALIRHLPSVETLGETTIICSDKTGTLTQNEMTVRKLYTYGKLYDVTGKGYFTKGQILGDKSIGESERTLLRIGALCNNASLKLKGKKVAISGDPTEAALLVSAAKAKYSYEKLRKQWKCLYEEPFDSNRKMMSTVHKDPNSKKIVVYTKGAPERVLAKCSKILVNNKIKKLTPAMKKNIIQENALFGKNALRVLGFAYKTTKQKKGFTKAIEKDLIFVGLQAMIDPPRDEVKHAIKTCHHAGIDVIMITGDNKITAQAIAKEIGLNGKAMEGAYFGRLSKAKQKKAVQEIRIFARVEPEHKMQIVEALQSLGHVVAMTGDGVNDAPAIKRADLGIAMGITGTDVAKESSEMILLDDNFTSIVNAVEEGRGIFRNVKKFVNYLLSSNLGEIFIIFFAVLLFGVESLPLTAIMLLWLNLVTDGLPALALSVDPNPPDVMKRPPTNASKGIMTKTMMAHIFFVSILITIGVLGLFKWAGALHSGDLLHMQTMAFTAVILFELIRLQTIRSEDNLGLFSNTWLLLAVITSIGLQLLVVYTPLSQFFGTVPLTITDWVMIVGVGATIYLLNIAGVRLHYKIRHGTKKSLRT